MDLGFEAQLIDPTPRPLPRMLGYSALGLVAATVVALRIMMWACPMTIEEMGQHLADALGFTEQQTAMIFGDPHDAPHRCVLVDGSASWTPAATFIEQQTVHGPNPIACARGEVLFDGPHDSWWEGLAARLLRESNRQDACPTDPPNKT